jgi:hypothetical protein
MDQIELSLFDCRLFCLPARETIIRYMYIKSFRSLINRDQQSQAPDSEFNCHRARSDLRSFQSQHLPSIGFLRQLSVCNGNVIQPWVQNTGSGQSEAKTQ